MDGGAVGEDLGEVVADGEGLQAEAQIAGDGHTVFADHCYAGAAIWLTLLVGASLAFCGCVVVLMENGEAMVVGV